MTNKELERAVERLTEKSKEQEWQAADALARAMYEKRFPDALWRGRKVNRAYWRRLAKGELHRQHKEASQ
jgi:hypothetical protein